MGNEFKVGDLAETIDDDIKGEIISITKDEIIPLTTEGFEMAFNDKELIKTPSESIDVHIHEINKVIKQELQPQKSSSSRTPKSVYSIEVDLHIHELIDDARRLSNYEILNIQMNHAKKRLEWAMQKRLKSVVFIHGVGQGVLREELHTLFRRYDNLEYFDANYQTYGVGATEVRLY